MLAKCLTSSSQVSFGCREAAGTGGAVMQTQYFATVGTHAQACAIHLYLEFQTNRSRKFPEEHHRIVLR